jgi:hypothetical protein
LHATSERWREVVMVAKGVATAEDEHFGTMVVDAVYLNLMVD